MSTTYRIAKDGIYVQPTKDGYIKCPYCEKRHKHGKVNGHRLAHCNDKSIKWNVIMYNDGMNIMEFNQSSGYIIYDAKGVWQD